MEQVWGNVSVWGFLTLLLTGLRVARRVIHFNSHAKTAQFFRVLRYQGIYFFRQEYKIWLVPVLSAFVLAFTGSEIRSEVLQSFFWTNALLCFACIVVGHLLRMFYITHPLLKAFQMLFKVNIPLSIGSIVSILLVNAYLLDSHPTFFGDTRAMLALLACQFLGVSVVVLSYRLWQYGTHLHPKPEDAKLLHNQRLEALIFAMLGVVLLSQMYGNDYRFTTLPLALSALMLLLSSISKAISTKNNVSTKYTKYFTGLFLLLSLGLIWLIFSVYLPVFWVKNSDTYYRQDLAIAMSMGLIMSFFSDKIIAFYRFLQERYTGFFLENPIFHRWVTYFVRGFTTVFLVSAGTWCILSAYQHMELYGLTLLLATTFANTDAKISFDIPAKWH